MTLKIEDFKAALRGGGVRPNLFQVIPSFPFGGDIELNSFMIKTASLPGSTLGKIPVPFRGRELGLAGDRTFEDWEITVLVDGEFRSRDAFEIWSNAINQHEENIGAATIEEYLADWRIDQLDRAGEVIKSYTIKNCWPMSIGAIELSNDTNDSIAEFSVTLEIESWSSNTTS